MTGNAAAGVPDLPSGTVTFVFTDIEGSTRLLRELGDDYDALLDLHHSLLRECWQEFGGVEVNTEGDAFFVAFADTADALRATVAGQRRLGLATWPGGHDVRVRMGLHAGFARPVGRDYRALAVHQAARVVSSAHGGQILVTAATVGRLAEVPSGVAIHPLGRYRIRDFDQAPELAEVHAAERAPDGRKPRARPADGHNLVRATTSMFGRAAELADLSAVVQPGRLVTVMGPGGVGKTRLVSELGLATADAWPDGVWFVDLAPVVGADVIPLAVASAVAAPTSPGADAWQTVLEHLATKQALLILDNCEHLLAGAARCAVQLVTTCPDVGVLATSRAPLSVRAEHLFRLDPLSSHDAVALFQARLGRELTAPEELAVRRLCDELDDLPLAIELAAARARVVPPSTILELLQRTALSTRDPGLPERQRSLDVLLDWSYARLEPAEQTLLRRLSIFVDSFDVEVIEEVLAFGDLDESQAVDALLALVDWSLVMPDNAGGGRYRLLRTVRAFAAARATDDEVVAALEGLARRFLREFGPDCTVDPGWMARMASAGENVRAVIAGLARRPGAQRTQQAQQLAWSVGTFLDAHDRYLDAIEGLRGFVDLLTDPTPARVGLLVLLANEHLRVGEFDEAAVRLSEADALSSEVGVPPWDPTCVTHGRATVALRRGDFTGAMQLARAALAHASTARSRARALDLLGLARAEVGDVEGAYEAFVDELAVVRESGMVYLSSFCHANLAELALRKGAVAVAAGHQLAALEASLELGGSVLQSAFSMVIAAHLLADAGEWERAVALHAAADVEFARSRFELFESDAARRVHLYERAAEELGSAGFELAVARGRSLDVQSSTDAAADALRAVAEGGSGR